MNPQPDINIESPDRWESSPPGADEAEIGWWREFSDVEEKYCWVQTPAIQRFLRGRYVREIAAAIPPGGRVLEFGCGTGWLSLLLAEYGSFRVCGVDFSPEQIARAEAEAKGRGLESRIDFSLIHGSVRELGRLFEGEGFDALIVHGVLHHLTNSEIRELIEIFRSTLSRPQARVFICEPVYYGSAAGDAKGARLGRLIDQLMILPLRGEKLGIRRQSAEERRVREAIESRNVGRPPRGPSPKEMPFKPRELEALLGEHLIFQQAAPVLLFSFLAAKNLLLAQLSHPWGARFLGFPYLWMVRACERMMLAYAPASIGYSVFELHKTVVRETTTSC
ncbi:MAG: class I SAM-dependent methyltransferase [Acidobacteria bacterium]|nr:class I SAM-dependent methyltransferase [Acidobacteriota bacterium]